MKKLFAIIALLSSFVSCFGQGNPANPGIAVEPQSQTAPAGQTLILAVTASGTAPFSYQWWDSTGAIPDATNATYILDPAEPTNSDSYFVTVNNSYGSVTSSLATLSIGLPPLISIQPVEQTLAAGSALTLTVTASGTAPLSYQWWDTEGPIQGATNATYILDPAEPTNSDNYIVLVSNPFGSTASSFANVTIGLPPLISVQPMSQNLAAGASLLLTVVASGTTPLGYQWWDTAGPIQGATNATYILNSADPTNSDNYFVTVDNSFGSVTSSVADVTIGLLPSISVQPASQNVMEGSSLTLSVTASGAAPLTYQWWDGAGAILDATNAIFILNPAEATNSDNYFVTINNSFGSVTSSVAAVSIGLPPSVSVQPVSQNVAAGATLTLTVTASGTAPLSYQWWDSAGPIEDATNPVFILNPAEPTNSDNYTVVVNNSFGSITSSAAIVTIGVPPSISVQPASQHVAVGSALTLTVMSSGTVPLSYQWWDTAGPILNATNPVFILNPAEPTNSDNYTVVVDNSFGSVTSSVADVTIGVPPSISVQPASQNVAVGASVTLTVTASGTAPLSYQWWNSVGPIEDATNATYILDPAEPTNSDNYTVVVNNSFGSITSSVAAVIIGLLPSISIQPVSQNVAAGSPLILIVTAFGTAPLSYQWWDRAGAIQTATNATYVLDPAEPTNSDNYFVTIKNSFGSVTSSVATVTIGLPPSISIQPVSQNLVAGSALALTVTAAGTAPLDYQWWDSSGPILNATNPVFILNPAEPTNSDNYTVVVNNSFGSITSSAAIVTIGVPPSISVQPMSQNLVAGSALTLTVTAAGTAPLDYQWWDSSGPILNATNPVFILNPAVPTNSDNYTVVVNNSFGSITSSAATVTIGVPPSISVQPVSQNLVAGSALTLTVTAAGTAPLGYQWWDSSGPILNATNPVFILNPAEPTNSDNYTVVIINSFGSITSSAATVTIGVPPSISVQPAGQTVAAGANVVLSVAANGTGPLSYQWQFNGTNLLIDLITTVAGNGIPGYSGDGDTASNASLNIPYGLALDALGNLYIADTGNQRVRKVDTNNLISTVAGDGIWGYSGDGGTATNANFLFPLDVAIDPSGDLLIADQDNHRIRQVDTNGVIRTVVGNSTRGNSGDGGAATNATLSFPHGLAVDAAGNLFIADSGSGFIREVGANGLIKTVAGNGGQGYSGDGDSATNASLDDPTGVAVDSSGNLFIADSDNNCIRKVDTNGIITTVAGNGLAGYSGDGGAAIDASLSDPTGVAVDGSGNLFIADCHNSLVRQMDSAGIISTIAGNNIANQYGFVGGYSGDGGDATEASLFYPYRVVLDGSGNLFIADLDNNRIRRVGLTTEPAITINDLNTNNAGAYTVVVSNPYGSITSSVATVAISLPPSISVPPASQTVAAGTSLTLTVTASGTAPLSYQWWDSLGAIQNATNAIYILNPAETNESDGYSVVISNSYGSITSSVAIVSIIDQSPLISGQFAAETVAAGTSATLTATATGSPPLSYQWWDSLGAIQDATNATYILNPAEPDDSGDYFVVVSNPFGEATGSVVALVVYLPVNITGQPQSQTVSAGATAILSATAVGTGPLGYQWQLNGTNLPSATSATLEIPNVQLGSLGDYVIVVGNYYGSTQSVAATLTMSPSILSPFTGASGIWGEPTTLSVTAEGSGTLTYQWLKNGAPIPGANSPTYTIATLQLTDGGSYSVVVSSSYGSVTNPPAQLVVKAAQIITQPQNQMVVEGSNATFSVVVTGDDLSYQWYGYGGNDTNLLGGSTNATLTVLTAGEGSQVYNLSVVVTNLAGVVLSSNASLTVLTELTGSINPYPPGTLGYDLFQSTFTLASSTNRTAAYDPPSTDLGTNSAVWTWPINLSCVGHASDYYESVLIASNELLTCAHDNGEVGQTVTFRDTNGVSWVGVVTNVINVVSDLDISQLSNSAPPSIVLPYVLPPDYGNYIAGNSLLGMPAFWLHGKVGSIDYAPVAWVGVANLEGGEPGTWMQLLHNGYGDYSGTSAIGGDSGDPAFLSLSNNPILLFALDLIPDAGGMFVSGELNWYWLSALGLTNGLNILDLSGYPLQSATMPTPDYNYIVPPTNQLAKSGALVTFDASICVFNTSPFAYQWQWNGANLPGATNAILTFQAETTNVGYYSVIVSNELGSVTVGATLALTGNQPPQILAPLVTNGQFQFGFNTISNNSYTVEYEDNLAGNNWIALTNFTGSGAYWQTPPLPLVTQRFYRFVTSPP